MSDDDETPRPRRPLPGTARDPLGRLRTRVALAAALAALIALLAGGVFVLASATAADRGDLDASLKARATQAANVGRRTLRATGTAARVTRRVDRVLGPVTGRGDVALIRLVRGTTVLASLGATADPGLPLDGPARPTTVATPDGRWRVAQRAVAGGIVAQAASPLAPLEERRAALRDRLLLAGAGGVLGTGLLAFLLAGPALAALTRLRRDAGRVASTADLDVRMPADEGPAEVRELAGTLNAMLARLSSADADRRAALETTQRFAADAGHELRTPLTALTTTVEALRAHPDLPADERAAMLGEIAEEHARLGGLLDALQALARGDAGARLDRGPVDLADLAEQAVAAARLAAPGTTFVLDAPPSLVVDGWSPGLRLLLDNLLRNTVRHGRPDGRVAVTLAPGAGGSSPGGGAAPPSRPSPDRAGSPGAASPGAPPGGAAPAAVLLVDDDGPGVPADEREAVLGRFARGRGARGGGSGLGLALVEQQARLHGGGLVLEDSPLGGLRARVTLR